MIVSNNLLDKMPISQDAVIRVNLAWVSFEEARELLDKSTHDIYLDFPSGRTKPPVPSMTLDQAVELSKHPVVKYFAVSNAESMSMLQKIDTPAILVPKIETALGVRGVPDMIKGGITCIMLDKEDLYTNVGCDSEEFDRLVAEVRAQPIKIFELQGVVFE